MKEQIKLYQLEKKIQGEKVTPETLLAEGKVTRTVKQGKKDNQYYMYYALKENAYNGMSGLGKGNIATLKDVFLIDDDLNVKYIANNGKEYGDNINNKILDDETEIRFSSKAFSEYISKILGITVENMKFKWMKDQTQISINNIEDMTNLDDLVFFPNLTSLYIQNMTLYSLTGIENCKNLKNFTIIDVKIKDYQSLSYLNNVESIYVQGSVDLEKMISAIEDFNNLKKLSLYATKLENIDLLKKLKNINTLNNLNLGVNKIKNVSSLKYLQNLTSLDLRSNLITDIMPLKDLTNLTSLNLTNNDIIDITPLAYNQKLQNLYLKGNEKIDGNRENYSEKGKKALDEIGKILERKGNIYLDSNQLGLFKNYRTIDLSNQNLSTLNVLEGMNDIESLTIMNNKLTLEDKKSQDILSSMSNTLKHLYITNNSLSNITAINNLKNLKILYIQGNDNIDLSEIEDIISNLDNLRIDTEALKTIKNCDTTKISKLNIDNSSYLTEIPDLSQFNNMKTLSLASLIKVKDFSSISKITSLNRLTLSGNNMHNNMMDFSDLNNLQLLSLQNCTLWSEDLKNLKSLKNNTNLTINLSNNSIIDATALLELNPNTKIYLTGNVNLSQDSKDKLKARFGDNVKF